MNRARTTDGTDIDLLTHVRKALASEPRLDLHKHPVVIRLETGDLVLEGETPSIAAKKLALEAAAAAAPQIRHIVDRLRVRPAERHQDGQILAMVRNTLGGEPTLADIALYMRKKGRREVVRVRDRAKGEIEVSVSDGVVTLDGEVPSLVHKRLAGLLAWWVPGSRDVINGLGVEPAVVDSDDEIAEAVRIALEVDPFIDANQVRIGVRRAVVTLGGVVASEAQRRMAEDDAWYIFGVDRVVNRIAVRP